MIAKIIDKNLIEVYDLSQFDLDAIMHSGQVFRYIENEGKYTLTVGERYAKISREDGVVRIECSEANYFFEYFDLAFDYEEVKNHLRGGRLDHAISLGGGIRILRSDFVEMVISFIVSANNNIKRFTKTLNALADRFGKRLPCGMSAFPTLEELAKATEADFKELGCGYRAPYLVRAVAQLSEIDPANLSVLPNKELIKALTEISGVGKKVASCIALFCGNFHRLDVVPIDTWIAKTLENLEPKEREVLLTDKYAGVAQQYIFYYVQHLRKTL